MTQTQKARPGLKEPGQANAADMEPQTDTVVYHGGGEIVKADLELIEKIKRSQNGETFSQLWAGNPGERTHSEASRALCDILAWWTHGDADRTERLFRQSGMTNNVTAAAVKEACDEACDGLKGGYDPAAYFQRQADKITVRTESGNLKLADLHPERNDRYRWTDIGSGNLFADWYKNVARYCPEKKKWFVYDGRVWAIDSGGVKTMQLCKELANQLVIYGLSLPDGTEREGYRKFVENWQNRRYRETILKDAASVYPVSALEFDSDPYIFNCLNGTLDLRTFDFWEHNPADMLSIVGGVEYKPAAKSPLWEETINEIMQGKRDLIAFLQKLSGRCLTGDTSEDRFYILHGRTTRNGKSTFTETLSRLLGRGYSRAVAPETIAQRKSVNPSGPSEDLARLMGARTLIVSEPDKSMTLSAGLIKTLSGGDTLRARNLNESTVEFTPCGKIIINSNWLPRIDDSTVFTSDRVCVLPFDRHFEAWERDTSLKTKLSTPENLSGILNWCLDGLRLIYETGFNPPESVTAATDEYWREADKTRRFFCECIIRDPQGEIQSKEAYQRYSLWCKANGQFPESYENFKKNMEPFAPCRRKRPIGAGKAANKLTLFCGVSWKQGA